MADATRCPDCGAELSPGESAGSCPRCSTRPAPATPPSGTADERTAARPGVHDAAEPTEPAHDDPGATTDDTTAPPSGPAPTRPDATGTWAVEVSTPTRDSDNQGAPPGLPRG